MNRTALSPSEIASLIPQDEAIRMAFSKAKPAQLVNPRDTLRADVRVAQIVVLQARTL